MKNVIGMKWSQLDQITKDELLSIAFATDARTGSKPKKSIECTIDFENGLSVLGSVEYTEEDVIITVPEQSIIYNSEDEVITNWMERMRAVRKSASLSQRKVKELMGIPTRTIEQWESGQRTPPEWVQNLVVEKINRIADKCDKI